MFKEMTSDQKNAADVMLGMYRRAWENYNNRRQYEWKLALVIWTALAAFVAILVRGQGPKVTYGGKALLLIPGGMILGLHIYFQLCIKLANDCDKAIGIFWESKLRDYFDVLGSWALEIQPKLDRVARVGRKGWYAAFVYVFVTLVLLVVAYCLV